MMGLTFKRLLAGIKQRLFTFHARKAKKEIAVLMFHEICEEQDAIDPNLSISFDNFKELISSIIDKRKIVSVENIENSNFPIAVITFDDAFNSILDEAVPFLSEKGIPFTIFICDELIGQPNYLNERDINVLKSNPRCSICYHAKHHVFLSNLSKNEFLDEINPSEFKKRFNVKCDCFAFPYGSFFASETNHLECLSENYIFCFSTINSTFSKKYITKHRYFLPRINVSNKTFKKVYSLLNLKGNK